MDGEIDYEALGRAVFRILPIRPLQEDVGRAVVAALEAQGWCVVRQGDLDEAIGWGDDLRGRGVDWLPEVDEPIYGRLVAAFARSAPPVGAGHSNGGIDAS